MTNTFYLLSCLYYSFNYILLKAVNKELESVWVQPSVRCFTIWDLTLTRGVEFW